MTVLEELRQSIEAEHPKETEKLVEEALEQRVDSMRIVEEAMMPAMRTMGERYKEQETDIPSILAAARCVRSGFALIEKKDASFEEQNIGTVIVGTVEGDLHDIGKNLVALMFRSAGFKVIDLGVDISEKQFLKAVRENPDVQIVCISSLLSTSLPEMEQVVKVLRRNDPEKKYKIMVGGGAVTKQLAEDMGAGCLHGKLRRGGRSCEDIYCLNRFHYNTGNVCFGTFRTKCRVGAIPHTAWGTDIGANGSTPKGSK